MIGDEMKAKQRLGERKVNLARKLFGKKLGDYFLTRFALHRYLNIDNLSFEKYLLTGNIPEHLWDNKVDRFENLRLIFERQLREKLKFVRYSTQFQILKKRLKEEW